MPRYPINGVVFGAVLVLVVAALPARADKCTGVKLNDVGKTECRLLGCQARVAASGNSSALSTCEASVKAAFATRFGNAGVCAGDETTCEDIAASCESSIAGALSDTFPSRCEAAKRKAAAHLTSGELDCYARAAHLNIPVDPSCIMKAQGKFGAAISKAGSCPDGGSPQDEVENNCVNPVVATTGGVVTDVCPSTTTTTTLP